MGAIDFYNTTEQYLKKVAKSYGVTDLTKYYDSTDFYKSSFVNNYKGLSRVFIQMAFHAQNATMISNIVNFKKNLTFLDELTFKFNPKKFNEEYNTGNRDRDVQALVEKLKYDENTNPNGLHWDSNKNKREKKDVIAKRYASCLLDCSEYLNQFNTENDVVNDLIQHYTNNNYRELVEYFRKKFKRGSGISVALACDFLKEFNKKFDLPKPDTHIMDTLGKYKNCKYKQSVNGALDCIGDFIALVNEINTQLKKPITVYQLDRMIWLICSNKFFLDNIQDAKSEYLKQI